MAYCCENRFPRVRSAQNSETPGELGRTAYVREDRTNLTGSNADDGATREQILYIGVYGLFG